MRSMARNQIQILGNERIPAEGMLVIPGRLNLQEAQAITRMFSGRKISWLVEESAVLPDSLRNHLERAERAFAFSAGDEAPRNVGAQLAENLADGGVLVHVPGQVRARPGTQVHLEHKVLETLCGLGLPILPIAIHRPRETRLTCERPSSLPASILSVGAPLTTDELSVANLRGGILEAFETAFSTRRFLNGSLGYALLKGLKKHTRTRIFDGTDDSEVGFDRILGAALVFAQEIREATDKPRIGIILPPGKGGLIANLATIFAGKTPVNLNFTASHDAIKSAIRQADLDRFITADPFVRKVPSFPWPPNRDLLFIERVLPALKKKIITWVILSKLIPARILALIHGIATKGGDEEAVLLFTSGSSGEPKGVPLTHRNLLANVCQFGTRLSIPSGARILGSLPLFHSFGCTATLCFPVIEGIDLVTYPNPLDTKRIAELIAQHQVWLLLATPTFLRGYMRRIDPDQLASLGLVVTGAEKLPTSFADAFEQRFGIRPQEGYGLTETSPATNLNLPNIEAEEGDAKLPILLSNRDGSVGQLLPGLGVRMTDPATDRRVPIDQQGIIWLRGANVFPGYLDAPEKTAEVIEDGWFRTGDVGRVDDDGFLFIEGRISRFSKIAGEMVPHESVEAAINKVLGMDSEAERKIAVIGVPDVQKGEAIVLLSTITGPAIEQECIDLRYKLLDEGLPSLWCPKQIIPVKEIPVLASGKLDIKSCEALVK
jgi:acyl-[acyl-carrier-protein]-phospholipid O-acyltransferase/long-chain-fatty-acid--[acyl-carrier-protein] ligase